MKCLFTMWRRHGLANVQILVYNTVCSIGTILPILWKDFVQCHHCPFSVCVPINTSWCPSDCIYRHEHWVHMRARGDKIVWSRRPREHLDYFFYYYGKSKYKYDKYIIKRSCLRANSRFLYKYNNLKILFDSIINEETNKMLSTDLTENSEYHRYVVESGVLKGIYR